MESKMKDRIPHTLSPHFFSSGIFGLSSTYILFTDPKKNTKRYLSTFHPDVNLTLYGKTSVDPFHFDPDPFRGNTDPT